MDNILDVNTSQMDQDAESYFNISTVVDQIGSQLQNRLSELGNFWGDDKVGNEFTAQWLPAIQGLAGSASGVSDGMKAVANGIKTSSGLLKNSNEVNSDLVA
jgi:uncharacterized protein YukE